MSTFVKSLQKKASRPFLRQPQPQAEGSGADQPTHTRNPSASTPNLLLGSNTHDSGGNTPTPNPASSSRTSRLFKRKTYIAPPPLPDAPKPILRRAVSPVADYSPLGSVRFPIAHHPHRRSTLSVASSQASSVGGPSGTSYDGRSPPGAFRQNFLPSSHSRPQRAPSPGGSVGSIGSVASSSMSRPHVYKQQSAPPASIGGSSRGSTEASRPGYAAYVASTYDTLSASGQHHTRTVSSSADRRRSMYRPSPPSSPYTSPRDAHARRFSRTPSLPASGTASPVPAVAPQLPQQLLPSGRPGSRLGHGVRGRKSSRPSQGSASRTRESITSLSSIKNEGHSPTPSAVEPGKLEPASTSIPSVQLPAADSLSLNENPVVLSSPPLAFNRLSLASPLTVIPQSPDTMPPSTPTLGLITPPRGCDPLLSPSLASTPGGACPWSPGPFVTPSLTRAGSVGQPASSARIRNQSYYPGDGSPLPLFQVIPATPAGHNMDTSLMLKSPSEAEDEMLVTDEKSHARVLDFGEPQWRMTTAATATSPGPALDEPLSLWHGSPFSIPVAKFAQEVTDYDSRASTPRPATPKGIESPDQSRKNTVQAPVTPPRNPARLSRAPQPSVPPKPAKSPRRSLYYHHDDGRTISHSLAELATLACDLPPIDDDMSMTAALAAARLAAARAATDTPINSPQARRAPPCAPPRLPPPPIPTNVAPFSAKGGRGPATPPPTVPRNAHAFAPPQLTSMSPFDTLPPSPDLDTYTYPSLPSLVMSRDGTMSNFSSNERLSLQSTVSLASTLSDTEEGMIAMVRQLSARSDSVTHSLDTIVSPSTPKALAADLGVGLGFGKFDFSAPCMSPPRIINLELGSPMRSPMRSLDTPTTFNRELALPDSPPLRIHRMSAAAANPNRAALYGTPSILVHANGSTTSLGRESHHSRMKSQATSHMSYSSISSSVTGSEPRSLHMSQGSFSSVASSHASLGSRGSIDFGSDFDEDEVLTASVVAFQPFAPAKYVVREQPGCHEVGVAF